MNAIVTKLLAKDPEDRYADADELADDLRRVNRGLKPVSAGVGRKRGQITQRKPRVAERHEQGSDPGPARLRSPQAVFPGPGPVAAILISLGTLAGVRAFLGPDASTGWFDFPGRTAISRPACRPGDRDGARSGRAHQAPARNRLSEAGLKVGLVSSFRARASPRAGSSSQGIAAGTPVGAGTKVNLDISAGPQPVSSRELDRVGSSTPNPVPRPGKLLRLSRALPAARIARRPRRMALRPRTKTQRSQTQGANESSCSRAELCPTASEPGDDSGRQDSRRGGGRQWRIRGRLARPGGTIDPAPTRKSAN